MAGEIEARVDADKLEKALSTAPRKLYAALKRRLGGMRGYLHKWVRKEIAQKKFKGGQFLHVRTGAFRRSFDVVDHGTSIDTLRFVTGAVRNVPPYADIHEYGGVITPKKGKFLAIPLEAAKTVRADVGRGGPRDFEDTFIFTSKAGNKIIAQRSGDGLTPLFVLKESVKIPPRLGFFHAWDAQMPALIGQFNKAIEESLQEAPAHG